MQQPHRGRPMPLDHPGLAADAGSSSAAHPAAPAPDPRRVLAKAVVNAGRGLGLSQETLAAVIGRERTTFSRGLDPDSKAGELALLVVRVYRSLFALVGGDAAAMRHWMQTANRDTGGVPAEQLRSVPGLVLVTEYLDAMRGAA